MRHFEQTPQTSFMPDFKKKSSPPSLLKWSYQWHIHTYTNHFIYQAHRWWIGLSDQGEEGTFLWEQSEEPPSFTYWYNNEPQTSNNREEDCVMLMSSMAFKWADVPCTDNAYPLCEMRWVWGFSRSFFRRRYIVSGLSITMCSWQLLWDTLPEGFANSFVICYCLLQQLLCERCTHW